jgi:cyclic-di-GMP-binding protein
MAVFSFDIVSQVDIAEMNNVFDQAHRELTNRYDFKNTPANIEWLSSDKNGFKVTGNSEWQIDAIIDIVRKKLAVRNQSQKLLDVSMPVHENNMRLTKEVPFVHGLDQAKAKKLQEMIRQSLPKMKMQVQGDSVRVSSSSKDELQQAISKLKSEEIAFPLQFINYR